MQETTNDNATKHGLPVAGYRPQSSAAVDAVNRAKVMEELVLRFMEDAADDAVLAPDTRWLAIGRTDIERGFMAFNRAIFKPERVAIPEEDEPIVDQVIVLERADSPETAPLFYAPSHLHLDQWSPNKEFALRFARREDAERLGAALAVASRVAEHRWS